MTFPLPFLDLSLTFPLPSQVLVNKDPFQAHVLDIRLRQGDGPFSDHTTREDFYPAGPFKARIRDVANRMDVGVFSEVFNVSVPPQDAKIFRVFPNSKTDDGETFRRIAQPSAARPAFVRPERSNDGGAVSTAMSAHLSGTRGGRRKVFLSMFAEDVLDEDMHDFASLMINQNITALVQAHTKFRIPGCRPPSNRPAQHLSAFHCLSLVFHCLCTAFQCFHIKPRLAPRLQLQLSHRPPCCCCTLISLLNTGP